MKKIFKKIILISIAAVIIIAALLIAFDKFFMPWYVDSPEYPVPDVVGKHKIEAIKILKEKKLTPVPQGPRYDSRFPKDHVILQKPIAGRKVKENRRVYIYISGGEPLVKMPNVIGKTLRDAKINVERLGFVIDTVLSVRSEFPADLVVEQEPAEGENLLRGSGVILKISVGPRVGMIRVPNLLGKSLKKAMEILRRNSLKLGKINYQPSPNLLPNTIIDQYPTEDKLVSVGDSIDVFVTSSIAN